ncbi:MAG: class I SAM-dependent methyltransferase [Solirubrobacterales bacterium]
MADKVYLDNTEAAEAWNGVLFDRFSEFRHIFVTGLAAHGTKAMTENPPNSGDRMLDIGCGFGDTTQQLVRLAGAGGSAIGVDVAERFIEAARSEAEEAAAANVEFAVMDVEREVPEGPFDYVFSRMGTMFFANPVPALRRTREQMRPGARLCMVVWRQKDDNPWVNRAERVVEAWLGEPVPDDSNEPTCGPGPFSMANANSTTDKLLAAGFTDITLRRNDLMMRTGRDLEEAVAASIALGPAAEIFRLAGDEAERARPQIEAALREALAEFETPDGVYAGTSTWTVTAVNPGD